MKEGYNIGISKITEVEFSKKEIKKNTTYFARFEVGIKPKPLTKEIDVILSYFIEDSENVENSNFILKITVINTFLISEFDDLKNQHNEETVNIPNDLLITMFSISVSHTRALLSKYINDTEYQNFMIPIINPTEVAKNLFGFINETK